MTKEQGPTDYLGRKVQERRGNLLERGLDRTGLLELQEAIRSGNASEEDMSVVYHSMDFIEPTLAAIHQLLNENEV